MKLSMVYMCINSCEDEKTAPGRLPMRTTVEQRVAASASVAQQRYKVRAPQPVSEGSAGGYLQRCRDEAVRCKAL